MSITFTCACGADLNTKAVGRSRLVCPACGLTLKAPLIELDTAPTKQDSAVPTHPRAEVEWDRYELAPLPPDSEESPPSRQWASPRKLFRRVRKGRSRRQLLPERFEQTLLWLPAALTLVTAAIGAILAEERGALETCFLHMCVTIAFILLVYFWALLAATFACAARLPIARSAASTIEAHLLMSLRNGPLSFLAGPAVLAGVVVLFWLEAGDLGMVDQLIVAQLGVAAILAWVLAFVAVTTGGRAWDAFPASAVQVVGRLRWQGTAGALLGSAAILLHGHWALAALEETHRSLGGWCSLFFCWLSLLFVTAALFYWLGRRWARGSPYQNVQTGNLP